VSHRVLLADDAFWRPSNMLGLLNTDLAAQLGSRALGARLWRLQPGEWSTRHRHREQTELYVVLEGSGQVKLDDAVYDVAKLDAVRVAPEVMRAFSAGPDGLEYLAYGAPAVVEPMQDVEMQQDWWSDASA